MIFTDWIHRFALDTLTSQDLARLHAAFEAGQDHEREACAKVCDDINAEYGGEDVLATWCSEAIRARNQE
jgi:hypothetical protein